VALVCYRGMTGEGEQAVLVQGEGWWAFARPARPEEDLRVAGRIPRDRLEGAVRITYDEALGLLGRPLPVPPAFHADEGLGAGAFEEWVGRRPLVGLFVGIVLYVALGAGGLWLAEAVLAGSVWAVFAALFAAVFLAACAAVFVAQVTGGFLRGSLFGGVYGLILAVISLVVGFAWGSSGESYSPEQFTGLGTMVVVAAAGGGVGSLLARRRS